MGKGVLIATIVLAWSCVFAFQAPQTLPVYEYPLAEPVQAISAFASVHSNDVVTNTNRVVDEEEMNKENAEEKSVQLCVDYTIEGYYESKVYKAGNPPSGYVKLPSAITPCQLEQLEKDCVDRINMFRSGQLKFSDGTSDSNVVAGLKSYAERTGSNQCSSSAAMGDLIANFQGGGGCAGAHANAFVCPWNGAVAQNTCCGRGGGSFGSSAVLNTYDKVKTELFSCLQQMWDEGMTSNTGQKGHWESMRSTTYKQVSCGFAWSTGGRVMMNQDFFTSDPPCTPKCTSCDVSDGCSSNKCNCNTTSTSSNSNGNSNNNNSGGLSPGATAAVVIVVLAVAATTAFVVYRKRHSIKSRVQRGSRAVAVKVAAVKAKHRGDDSSSNNSNKPKEMYVTAASKQSNPPSRVMATVTATTATTTRPPPPPKPNMATVSATPAPASSISNLKSKFGG